MAFSATHRKQYTARPGRGYNAIFTLIFIWSPMVFAKEEIRIGVQSIWGQPVVREMWQPTIDYLNKHVSKYQFSLQPLNLSQTRQAVSDRQIDFIITNPGNYVALETEFGITRLLTLNKLRQDIPSARFGAVIFTRADNPDIKTLDDLLGKPFMAVTETAFGGFQMAWRELKLHGIDPFEDFRPLSFSGFPQDKVVFAVRDKKVAAGTVRTDTLERMASKGVINLGQFRILAQKSTDNFPFLHSTQLYPEWPFARLAHTPLDLAKQVTTALLLLPGDTLAARAVKSVGWTVPLDYRPVRELMKELAVEPGSIGDLPLKAVLNKYDWLITIILISIILPVLGYIKKLQQKVGFSQQLADKEAEWNHVLDFFDESICVIDPDDRLLRANKSFYHHMQTTPSEAIGEKFSRYCHPSGNDNTCPICRARESRTDTVLLLEADDPVNKFNVPVEIAINLIQNKDREMIALIQGIRDLSHAKMAETAIRQNETRLRDILKATPDPLLIVDKRGVITLANRMFEKQFGYHENNIIGQSVDDLVTGLDLIRYAELHKGYRQQSPSWQTAPEPTIHCLHKDGRSIPVEISFCHIETEEAPFITVALRDISANLGTQLELNRRASLSELSPFPIIEFSDNGELTYINPIASDLFPDLGDTGGKHIILQDILSLKNELADNQNELVRDIEINGAMYEQKVSYNPQQGLLRIYLWDITNIRDMTRQMAYQATHDSLTGLINRGEFEFRLKQALQSVEHEGKQHVLCYMDLDQFKIVNDTCGHIAGDELLKQISVLLLSKIRESDNLARIGGDEFGLLLIGCPVNTARMIAEKLRACVEDYRFTWQDKNFKIGISIGLVPILDKGLTVSKLLSAADTACYIAKEDGRNRIHTYNPQDTLSAKHTSEMNWVHRIHKALEEDRLELFCQQILNLANPSHLYYEILIRMRGEDGEIIPPLAFLPAAERYGLIAKIDKYVIEQTLQAFSANVLARVNLSINLSGQTLSDHNTMNFIINTIEKYNFAPERLTFEVTETAMVANLTDAIRFISTLKGLGCRFALDDFGSGFSSFAYLKNLPVDIIKIDGGFVRDMINDTVNAVMVESMIHIGHHMNLKTVAEFVENTEILNALQRMGIDYAQGYGIARPISLIELQSIVSSDKIKREA